MTLWQAVPSELRLRLTNGQPWELSDYRGQVVLIAIMGQRTATCEEIARHLRGVRESYGRDEVQLIALAIDAQAKEGIEDLMRRSGDEIPVAVSSSERMQRFLGFENGLTVPAVVFIDRRGLIRDVALPDIFRDTKIPWTETRYRGDVLLLLFEPRPPTDRFSNGRRHAPKWLRLLLKEEKHGCDCTKASC